jgi:crotonobetainyl-CoA:carnitine CoA-transferase CaiB-like acyl-CoA transferase
MQISFEGFTNSVYTRRGRLRETPRKHTIAGVERTITKRGPLDGVHVLDLTRAVAGPFCTMLLGDLGARVIKIEEPEGGDETRHWGQAFEGGESAYFLALNRNKESIALDLKQANDLSALRKLAREADVIVQNFRPGVVERLGIDYETLRADHPGLVYASISGFGLTGPFSERPGYDLIMQAMSGMMLSGSRPGDDPARCCFPVADILAGQFASQGILAALFERQKTGHGTHVEVALLDSLLSAMSYLTASCLLTGKNPEALYSGHPSIVPYQVLHCQDAWIAVAVPNDRIWQRFCKALNKPEWARDPRYATNQSRIEHRASLLAEMEGVLCERSSAEWQVILEEHHIPSGPLLSVAEILQHPQIIARDTVVTVDHPKLGPVKLIGSPMRFLDRTTVYRSPPTLGEHTSALLEEKQLN